MRVLYCIEENNAFYENKNILSDNEILKVVKECASLGIRKIRIRLTSNGFLKTCLNFNYGLDLKEYIKNNVSNEELRSIISKTIYNKPEKHDQI